MPTDPETSLALAAAVQRLANWTGAGVPPAPAVRRVREEGQSWAVIASLLGLDALPCHVDDPARLAFDYCAGLARPPEFERPRFLWDCPACGQTIADHEPTDSPACSQQGHAAGCERLVADVAEWERRAPR
jgi:hypothetical protein